jgi:hypothetical protein
MISTTVTSLSYAGQNVLTVTDSSGFLAGQTVRIGRGTADDETGVIASVGTGTITKQFSTYSCVYYTIG